MKCPHCSVAFHNNFQLVDVSLSGTSTFNEILYAYCPECKKINIYLHQGILMGNGKIPKNNFLVFPKRNIRTCSPDVPSSFAEDFNEACLTLPDSPKASAALSRRCLQNILREVLKVKHGTLESEIEEAIISKGLPSHITEDLHAVRVIGNFAAHPIKNTSTGEIIEVEEGEAEFNLNLLEALFDFCFVQPALSKKRKTSINEKLKAAGKPLLE